MQIKLVEKGSHVVGIGIHLIAVPGLIGAPMPAQIVRDHAIAAHYEEQHMRVPGVGRERPPMRENDRLSGYPIFIKYACDYFVYECTLCRVYTCERCCSV